MYDVIIIGAGPAGLTACLYALRSRLKVLLIDRMGIGGGLAYIDKLENYPGFPQGVSGRELSDLIGGQLKQYEFNFQQKDVQSIVQSNSGYWKLNSGKECFETKTIIVAAGASPKQLGVPGEKEFTGKGVSYCAVCDAPFFKNKDVVVIGGGNTALEEAVYLSRFADKVSVIHRRDEFRADAIVQEKARSIEKIKFIMSSVCLEITGTQLVSAIKVKSNTGKVSEIICQGVFIFVGTRPETSFLPDTVKKNELGYVLTDQSLLTSSKGIFACGDCRDVPLRQVVTACGEGAVAADSARKFLERT